MLHLQRRRYGRESLTLPSNGTKISRRWREWSPREAVRHGREARTGEHREDANQHRELGSRGVDGTAARVAAIERERKSQRV